MKNLMIIVPSLATGGQEKVAALTADFLKEHYNVYMVIFERGENEFPVDVPVICLDSPSSSNPFYQAIQVTKRNYLLYKLKKKLHKHFGVFEK